MANFDNYTMIRNGIKEHIANGKLSPFDLGVYTFMHLFCDFSRGTYLGSAPAIASTFGSSNAGKKKLVKEVADSLRRLRAQKYINYAFRRGSRGNYPILLNKFMPSSGQLVGLRLNAFAPNSLECPVYEPVTRQRHDNDMTTTRQRHDNDMTRTLSKTKTEDGRWKTNTKTNTPTDSTSVPVQSELPVQTQTLPAPDSIEAKLARAKVRYPDAGKASPVTISGKVPASTSKTAPAPAAKPKAPASSLRFDPLTYAEPIEGKEYSYEGEDMHRMLVYHFKYNPSTYWRDTGEKKGNITSVERLKFMADTMWKQFVTDVGEDWEPPKPKVAKPRGYYDYLPDDSCATCRGLGKVEGRYCPCVKETWVPEV